MNGFLVYGLNDGNDVPLRLCPSREDALAFAQRLTWDDIVDFALNVSGLNAVGSINVVVVEFVNSVPQGTDTIHTVHDESEVTP